MQAIGYNCSELETLNLGWCENVGDLGVTSLAYGCPELRALNLCGCVLITGISWKTYWSLLMAFPHCCSFFLFLFWGLGVGVGGVLHYF